MPRSPNGWKEQGWDLSPQRDLTKLPHRTRMEMLHGRWQSKWNGINDILVGAVKEPTGPCSRAPRNQQIAYATWVGAFLKEIRP